jgi:hypothetical protein
MSGLFSRSPPGEERFSGVIGVASLLKKICRGPSELNVSTVFEALKGPGYGPLGAPLNRAAAGVAATPNAFAELTGECVCVWPAVAAVGAAADRVQARVAAGGRCAFTMTSRFRRFRRSRFRTIHLPAPSWMLVEELITAEPVLFRKNSRSHRGSAERIDQKRTLALPEEASTRSSSPKL